MARKRKYSKPVKLTEEQERFLNKILKENFKLSDRETYVVNKVLSTKEYHSNYQYHLNKIIYKYKKSKNINE